jgi:hypothetical protein
LRIPRSLELHVIEDMNGAATAKSGWARDSPVNVTATLQATATPGATEQGAIPTHSTTSGYARGLGPDVRRRKLVIMVSSNRVTESNRSKGAWPAAVSTHQGQSPGNGCAPIYWCYRAAADGGWQVHAQRKPTFPAKGQRAAVLMLQSPVLMDYSRFLRCQPISSHPRTNVEKEGGNYEEEVIIGKKGSWRTVKCGGGPGRVTLDGSGGRAQSLEISAR